MEDEDDRPRYLIHLADQLNTETDATVTIVPEGEDHWLLEVHGEKVQLEAHYKGSHGTGAWVTINGVTSRFFGDPSEFTRFYHDTSSLHDGFVDPEPLADGIQMPAAIQQIAAVIRTRLHREPAVSFNGDYWTVDARADATRLRLFFTRSKNRWGLAGQNGFQFISNGEDLTAQCGGRLDNALKLLLLAGGNKPGQAGASSTGPARASVTANSVLARRIKVIRV